MRGDRLYNISVLALGSAVQQVLLSGKEDLPFGTSLTAPQNISDGCPWNTLVEWCKIPFSLVHPCVHDGIAVHICNYPEDFSCRHHLPPRSILLLINVLKLPLLIQAILVFGPPLPLVISRGSRQYCVPCVVVYIKQQLSALQAFNLADQAGISHEHGLTLELKGRHEGEGWWKRWLGGNR